MTEVLIGILCVLVIVAFLIFFYKIEELRSTKTEDNLEKYYKDEFGEP